MKKTFSILLAVLLLAVSVCGCGGSKTEYRDDAAVSDLAQGVLGCISKGGDLAAMNESYVKGIMGMDLDGYSEYTVYVSAVGTNIDEFGIFKVSGISADDAHEQLEAYLKMREDTWMKEYTPEEHPKLQNAEIITCGNYVMYVILSDSERACAMESFEEALVK